MSATEPTPPRNASSARNTAFVTILVTLVAGILLGIVLDRTLLWRLRAHGRGMHVMTTRLLVRLDSELGLTPQQHEKVARILETHRGRVTAVFESAQPQIRKEIDQANAEIENTLSPEQRVRFQQMKLRMRGQGNRAAHPPFP